MRRLGSWHERGALLDVLAAIKWCHDKPATNSPAHVSSRLTMPGCSPRHDHVRLSPWILARRIRLARRHPTLRSAWPQSIWAHRVRPWQGSLQASQPRTINAVDREFYRRPRFDRRRAWSDTSMGERSSARSWRRSRIEFGDWCSVAVCAQRR